MSEFDAIVVGAGPAGSSAAIKMANAGLKVLLVERGDPPGTKNVSGGILWGKDLSQIIPDWEKTAPLERFVERKVTSFLTADSEISIDFKTLKFSTDRTGYAVLRTRLDQYLSKKASQAGATVITGITVDSLHMENGKVLGVVNEEDTITSDCVILAEGANPRVAIKAGLRQPPGDDDVALGIKQVYKLPEATINERYNLRGNAGFAGEYVLSFLEDDVYAGGFLYTNKDSISAGVVVSLSKLRENGKTRSFDIMEKFVSHPFISRLLEGGQIQEYSAHLVYEGGYSTMAKLYGNGYMIAGDAAGFSFSNGMVIEGMNYAIASGIMAGEAAIQAKKEGDFSDQSLSRYGRMLEESYAIKDKKTFRGIEKVTWSPLVHRIIPRIAENSMMKLFNETGEPKDHVVRILLDSAFDQGISKSDLLIQGYRLMRRM
ncbi:MAG: FAD-dependent oxidoreductase [Candidatus Thermoplasmatota archaeon]|jgi:electron transfer flavoprotein-quinone oxidoreductase|nr:FAD-dependent oxidoreductase [Candidatus Thermoplasmatota archaeon]MCL5794130.1 FAD-dependent oxidoreductase [Candidatus Thermoplasmatota archaeon]